MLACAFSGSSPLQASKKHHKPPRITLWLADLGMAMMREESADTAVTTAWYRAPEILLGFSHTAAADVWSLGVLLRRLAVGSEMISTDDKPAEALQAIAIRMPLPLPEEWPEMYKHGPLHDKVSHIAAMGASARKSLTMPKHIWDVIKDQMPEDLATWTAHLYGSCKKGSPAISKSLSKVLFACLQPNPSKRCSMDELLSMPFWTQGGPTSKHALDLVASSIRRAAAQDAQEMRRNKSPLQFRHGTIGPCQGQGQGGGHGQGIGLEPARDLAGRVSMCLDVGMGCQWEAMHAQASARENAPCPHIPLRLWNSTPSLSTAGRTAHVPSLNKSVLQKRVQFVDTCVVAAYRMGLPPISTALYTIDFVDRISIDLQHHHASDSDAAHLDLDLHLHLATAAAMFLSQGICADFRRSKSLGDVLAALKIPADKLLQARETCCRMLTSLRYTVHGGNDQDPTLWSTWKALRKATGGALCIPSVAVLFAALCVWPLYPCGISRMHMVQQCVDSAHGIRAAQHTAVGAQLARMEECDRKIVAHYEDHVRKTLHTLKLVPACMGGTI